MIKSPGAEIVYNTELHKGDAREKRQLMKQNEKKGQKHMQYYFIMEGNGTGSNLRNQAFPDLSRSLQGNDLRQKTIFVLGFKVRSARRNRSVYWGILVEICLYLSSEFLRFVLDFGWWLSGYGKDPSEEELGRNLCLSCSSKSLRLQKKPASELGDGADPTLQREKPQRLAIVGTSE